ncbi:MAG: alanine racemase [Planctomycetes bacterium]|nr:alanine racemase [Planctomycetota bacterium]
MQNQVVAEVNLSALEANYRTLAALAAPARVIAPVKADAYGHGAVACAQRLAEAGTAMLAVVSLNEALELRDAGIKTPILVMGVTDPKRIDEAVARRITVAVHSREYGQAYAEAAKRADGTVICHVHADTGMHRMGTPCDDVVPLIEALTESRHVKVEALMTHHSHSEDTDPSITNEQRELLARLAADLERRGLRPPVVHAANSAALMRFGREDFDMVRPGIALYGVTPCPELTPDVQLRPIMTIRAPIVTIKDVPAGQGVSYSHTWVADRPSRVAALPVGYADGYRRGLSNRTVARVKGRLVPAVGNVCMDTTLIDVTDVPQARVGSMATMMEAQTDSPLSVYALAGLLGTIPHEIFCGIGRRVRRVYVGDESV